jgi:hypothetical protein
MSLDTDLPQTAFATTKLPAAMNVNPMPTRIQYVFHRREPTRNSRVTVGIAFTPTLQDPSRPASPFFRHSSAMAETLAEKLKS